MKLLLPGLAPGLVGVQEVPRPSLRGVPDGFRVERIVYGSDPYGRGLDVVVARYGLPGGPGRGQLHRLVQWRARKTDGPIAVAVAVPDRSFWVYEPSTDPVGDLPEALVERIFVEILGESSGAGSRERLSGLLVRAAGSSPGIDNRGLFATRYLMNALPRATGWLDAVKRARPLLRYRNEELILNLGFRIRKSGPVLMLGRSHSVNEEVVAVILEKGESFDRKSPRFSASPVTHGLTLAREGGLDWLIAIRDSQIRLYSTRPGAGIESRGRTETYFELDLVVLRDDHAAFLYLVFSSAALSAGGSVAGILEGSRNHVTGLGDRLRKRIKGRMMPALSVTVAQALQENEEDPARAYRIALRILFRLLFQAYAEDRGLLPSSDPRYAPLSLKKMARELLARQSYDAHSTALWDRLAVIWKAIDAGNKELGIPAYNGGLFGCDSVLHPEGAALDEMQLEDDIVGPALRELLVDRNERRERPVDFRELSVWEFGTIYEGLLGCAVSRAVTDLGVDSDGAYVPVHTRKPRGVDVAVRAGALYFRDTTGGRKEARTHHTPGFAVRHLLEQTMSPALEAHLERVKELLEDGQSERAAEKFFDFRVADLAMGSGHFLVGAIDYIEAPMSAFLEQHDLPLVQQELERLRAAALAALPAPASGPGPSAIETAALLRRQIARRCVYGVELNPVAVDLARVAVWLHTFVPGLPISGLDHNLVYGDSLTGIEDVDAAVEILDPLSTGDRLSLFRSPVLDVLEQNRALLSQIGRAAEADKAEVQRGAERLQEARKRARSATLLFDTATALRIDGVSDGEISHAGSVTGYSELAGTPDVKQLIRTLAPVHFPALFPEVFQRDNPGFDVVIGNPPWEKVKVD